MYTLLHSADEEINRVFFSWSEADYELRKASMGWRDGNVGLQTRILPSNAGNVLGRDGNNTKAIGEEGPDPNIEEAGHIGRKIF